ncbi:uncharacterized protein [Euphorbia lathyris]|uniref:uncharacterized protein isoform X2 n=1 Tax=Euphorbia lathyris TaxID=212925 RepID=UPI0033136173
MVSFLCNNTKIGLEGPNDRNSILTKQKRRRNAGLLSAVGEIMCAFPLSVYYCSSSYPGEDLDSIGDGIVIQIQKLGRNSRRIRSKIAINASLDDIWKILTDYEKLADFIPGLAVSKLIDKKDNFARLYQIGQQNLPLGLKFNAKAILDCFEKDLETFNSKKKRDIDFKMIEGDFKLFEGKWSIEQVCKPRLEDSDCSIDQAFETTLSYSVDAKPKLWLPVHLVEGRLCKEIQTNLSSIREEAEKVIDNTLHAQ